jgi:hypothetical protein
MSTVTVSAADRTLFHVAAAQLADATQWWRIAQANGITDPWLVPAVPLVLTVPPADASQTGGVPPQ